MKAIVKSILLFLSVLLITLSNSSFASHINAERIMEYFADIILLAGIFLNQEIVTDKKRLVLFAVTMITFSVGIILQQLDFIIKFRLIISMLLIASMGILPCRYISNWKSIRTIKKALIMGIVVSIIGACISIGPEVLLTKASEGFIVPYGFNGGITHRNYFSYIVLAILAIEIMENKVNKKRCSFFIGVCILMILVSNSRSAYFVTLILIAILYYERIRICRKHKRILTCLIVCIAVLLAIPFYNILISVSETFWFRTNGLRNYLNKFYMSSFHMFLGNAEMAFKPGATYNFNIKNAIGWNGSTELVVLNVLIKNGLIGFLGYFIIFRNYFKIVGYLKNKSIKDIAYAVLVTFLISAFVESYVANINMVYSVFCYLFLTNIDKVDRSLGESV